MSDKKYYLGIDGGGSKTAFIIIDENNNKVYYNEQGPSSIDTVSNETLKTVLFDGVKGFKYKVVSVFAGLGGIATEKHKDMVKEILKELPICDKNTKVSADNDVVNALYGSLKGNDGIVVISGTGSVCFGKKNNKYARAGGYCYQEGDPGSAYDLGMKSLRYLAKVIDHRFEKSDFSNALSKTINCYTYTELVNYFINSSRTKIAQLAKIVTQYQDDAMAKKIIKEGVDEVLLMIKAVYNQLSFDNEVVEFSIVGSLGNANTLYKQLLLEGLNNISNKIVFVEKRYDACYGSAFKAKEG